MTEPWAQPRPIVAPTLRTDGGRTYAGITYAEIQGYRPLDLDLYVPPGQPRPVVVWIHGGAFWAGDRRYLPWTYPTDFFDRVVAAGLAVATVDYRLSSEATFPAPLDDVVAAIEFLRHNTTALGIDGSRIGTWGESAGGALAALSALRADTAAAVPWYPVTDLMVLRPDAEETPEARLLGAPPARVPELARQASAAAQARADAPPFLIVHGEADTVLPVDQAHRLHRTLRTAGARSTLVTVPGADHCFDGYADIGGLVDDSIAFLVSALSAGDSLARRG
jgi:acetyl esterase/lipase